MGNGWKKRPLSSSRWYILKTYLKYNRNVNFDRFFESNDEFVCFHIVHIGIFHPSLFFIHRFFFIQIYPSTNEADAEGPTKKRYCQTSKDILKHNSSSEFLLITEFKMIFFKCVVFSFWLIEENPFQIFGLGCIWLLFRRLHSSKTFISCANFQLQFNIWNIQIWAFKRWIIQAQSQILCLGKEYF